MATTPEQIVESLMELSGEMVEELYEHKCDNADTFNAQRQEIYEQINQMTGQAEKPEPEKTGNIVYEAHAEAGEVGSLRVMVNVIGIASFPLPHHILHSPTGFQMGHEGSGPADLARSILICHFRRTMKKESAIKEADKFYQGFKREFIAPAKEVLVISDNAITRWLETEQPST